MSSRNQENWVPLPPAINPLTAVRQTTTTVCSNAQHVAMNQAAVEQLAKMWATDGGGGGASVGWEETGWHYSEDAAVGGNLTCTYVFVLDCLNFCFWPTPGLEYEHLAFGLKAAVQRDPLALSADRLAVATEDTIRGWFSGFEIPQISERAAKLRELGCVLQAHFGGEAALLVARAARSAARLVRLLTCLLPGFRDETLHQGRQCFFYKRAQILAADLWAAYGRPPPGSGSLYAFEDIGELTMFADYRVPQVLAHLGVLEYSQALETKIDGLERLHPGSEEEVEIRAMCVQAVEGLRSALARRNVVVTSVEIDWRLWHEGERIKKDIQPHHRTLTCFY
ncbi:unnamed protein product [Ectocarpus sp. 13 AM-2016]